MFSLCFKGIFISRVSENGPAARAGVKVGDKLLEVKMLLRMLAKVNIKCIFSLKKSKNIKRLNFYNSDFSEEYQTSHLSPSQVNGVNLHEAEHHTAVEALRSSGATVSMTVLRERMVEPENAITTTPLRPEDDYFPRERRSSGLAFNLETSPSGPKQRISTCLIRNDKGLGFSIAGGKGSTPYRTGDTVTDQTTTKTKH